MAILSQSMPAQAQAGHSTAHQADSGPTCVCCLIYAVCVYLRVRVLQLPMIRPARDFMLLV